MLICNTTLIFNGKCNLHSYSYSKPFYGNVNAKLLIHLKLNDVGYKYSGWSYQSIARFQEIIILFPWYIIHQVIFGSLKLSHEIEISVVYNMLFIYRSLLLLLINKEINYFMKQSDIYNIKYATLKKKENLTKLQWKMKLTKIKFSLCFSLSNTKEVCLRS